MVVRAWNYYIALWTNLKGRRLFLFYILHYTILFAVMSLSVFSQFLEGGRTFIWRTDGFGSYLPSYIYTSQTFRDGVQALLQGEGWKFPLYDFRTGPAQSYLEMEPLQWLAVIWPWDKVDILYDILVILRYYLAGLSFSVMGFYFRQRPIPIMIGAVSYIFCGFSLFGGVRHPFFLAPMIFLPLLIIGMENILIGKNALIFTVTIFISLINSLYFSCMLAIFVFVFFVSRYLFIYYKDGIRGFVSILGRITIWGGTGLALGCIVSFPVLLQMFGTGRIGREVNNLFCYSTDVYEKFISYFIITPNSVVTWGYLGFSILAVPSIILLFLGKDKSKNSTTLKCMFVILTLMFFSPTITYIMSGFNTISARWCFGYALCVSAIIMFELPRLQSATRSDLMITLGLTTLYIVICRFAINQRYFREDNALFLVLIIFMIVFIFFAGIKARRMILPVALLVTCISVNYSGYLLYDINQQNYSSQFMKKDVSYTIYDEGQYGALGSSEIVKHDDEFFRVGASNLDRTNSKMSFYWGLNGLSYYTSTIAKGYREIENALEVMQREQSNWNFGIEGRAPILSLFNTKYYALRGSAPIPYGYKVVDTVGKDAILQNQYFLPIGYTYRNYMTEDEFNMLTGIEKQDAMLQAVVLAKRSDNDELLCTPPDIRSKKIPIKIESMNGLSWKRNQLKVFEENATITLSFNGIPGSDTYLRVVNLDLTAGGSTRRWNLAVDTLDTQTYARFSADAELYTHGLKTQVLYLGNSPDGYMTCTLTFPQKGTFILDDLEIWCQPMDHYAEQIEALRAEPLENVETNWRGLTGTVNLSKDKIMCFGIPYETGWSVYVDGEKHELMQANIGLMAVELSAGFHEIELKYWMPGLTAGIILSCIGVAGLIFLIIWQRKKTKRVKNENVDV